MTFRPMPIMSLLLIPALAVLVYLGSWQWQRYGEKQNAEQGIGLSETFALTVTPLDVAPQFIYSTYDGSAVWRVFQAMTGCLTDEAGEEVCSDAPLFVDLGLISGTEPSERLATRAAQVEISGRYREVPDGRRTMLTPEDIPERDMWYAGEAVTLAQHLELNGAEGARFFEPETITQFALTNDEIVNRRIPNPYVSIANLDNLPPARHLGYALTWFGLALGMIGVYIALHMARGRLRFS